MCLRLDIGFTRSAIGARWFLADAISLM